MKKTIFLIIVIIFVIGTYNAEATLIERSAGLVYDTDFDITWLQNGNYAGTTMNWNDAVAWTDNLEYYDPIRNVTWDDWRLPTALNRDGSGPCEGYLCTESEMGHIYYTELKLEPYGPPGGFGPMTDFGPFFNLVYGSSSYWTGTEYNRDPNSYAWRFSIYNGSQLRDQSKDGKFYVMAVRNGDVAPMPEATVPEPSTILLLGSGLAGILLLRKRLKV